MTALKLFYFLLKLSLAMRLNPLENNEMLQDISNQYVAELQWESWPIKQDSSEQGKSPGARTNVALWKDSSGFNWYLFGGKLIGDQSNKVFSDVWKYSTDNRMWERFFPSQIKEATNKKQKSEVKDATVDKIGGIMTLRANLFEENQTVSSKNKNYTVVLCGEMMKKNITKIKKQSVWNNFTRRKKLKEEKKEELRSLAVYSPDSKSNAVWQIDLKEKLWAAYICCCDAKEDAKDNSTFKENNIVSTTASSTTEEHVHINSNFSSQKNLSSLIDSKISKIEDEMSNEKIHLNISTLKMKKKKINQSKTLNEAESRNVKIVEKRNSQKRKKEEIDVSAASRGEHIKGVNNTVESSINQTESQNKTSNKSKKEKYNLKMMAISKINKMGEAELQKEKNKTVKMEEDKLKMTSKYCPEFLEGGETIAWCDGRSEVLVSALLNPADITFWIFNLKDSHWHQEKMEKPNDINWPECLNSNSIRYVGNEEETYIICSSNKISQVTESTSDYASPSKNPSTDSLTARKVFKLNYKLKILESLGEIRLNSFFDTVEGQQIWKSNSESSFHVFRTSDNETILFMTYLDSLDLWILTSDQKGKSRFELIEKIWRGSALKWFNKYNSALYNFQVVAENENKSETILMANPRIIGANEYWPRDRGRFIIRIFKNENLKNQSFENKTREQNLTYELLQSDYKQPTAENTATHSYNLKVFLFFGISLAIFSIFGFVIFLRRCVTCPPTVRERNECHKSPLVIRYSVIPDDLLYPVA